jgi:hypothetical protein
MPSLKWRSKQEADGVEPYIDEKGVKHRSITKGANLAANYVNSLILDNTVLVPQYQDENDKVALETYRQVFPDKIIVGVPAREILLGGGSIHCITCDYGHNPLEQNKTIEASALQDRQQVIKNIEALGIDGLVVLAPNEQQKSFADIRNRSNINADTIASQNQPDIKDQLDKTKKPL